MSWIFFSFLITAFGQPAWVRGLGPIAASFGFALFWKGMAQFRAPKSRFLLSLVWFAGIQAIQFSWFANLQYMGPFILIVYLFLVLGMGVQFAFLSLFVDFPMNWRKVFAIAGCWTLFEWSRLYFLCGFTWNPVGLSLTDSLYSIQFASLFGIFGLSFWVILSNLAALDALYKKTTRSIVVWASLSFFPYLFGVCQQSLVESSVPFGASLKVALIQTALFPEQKDRTLGFLEQFISPLDQWERISSLIDREKKVDLIVLPEAALPFGAHEAHYDLKSLEKYFSVEKLPPLRRPYAIFHKGAWRVSNAFLLQSLANQYDAHVISGLDDSDFNKRYNAAFHFAPGNRPYERYEKQVLVPVGEYVPLRNWRRFAQFVGEQFGIHSSFDPGIEGKIFNASVPIGISICLEETFSGLIRDLRLKGAEILVNITNDVWFPNSKLPRQHFDHGRVRAAENGVPLLRACNTGFTGVIDCFGSSLAQLPVSEKNPNVLYFSIPVRSFSTLYTWWGDQAILGISALSVISYFLFRKKKLL
jgi:apolipoprotein N-acyltransferase